MIDLHIHLLPGVDDGPETAEEAVRMCRLAATDGCEILVATPHQHHPSWWNSDAEQLRRLLAELQSAVGARPQLLLGAEIRIGPHLLADLERRAVSGLLALAGSRYLLLEPDRHGLGPDPRDLVHELVLGGWRPIVAHPELIPGLGEDLARLSRLVDAGAMLQVTASSVTGRFGRSPRQCAHALLDANLVHFVASDAHGERFRPPDLGTARTLLAERWGEETAWRLCDGNPRAVVEDRPPGKGLTLI